MRRRQTHGGLRKPETPALVLTAMALAVACAQPATARLRMEKLAELQPGVTTTQDVIELFGQPQSVSDAGGGNQLLQWIRASPFGAKHIAILFDASGKMIRITHRFKS